MPKIIIDGVEIQCRDKIPVLQAALEAGLNVPHYCYHPGLSIVASCRLCLMEMKMPDPKTKEMVWSPKLVPSCQTLVKEGMEVRFNSPAVIANRDKVMEYYLVNHPLDCPVCDQAGECYLQDYSFQFGKPYARTVDPKVKNPKKDIGSRTLLYQDRCVLCSRCVRFAQEVAGSGELCIVNRGDRAEIDVFPGMPLENKLQGNVVDLCPVGALLDKDFLFRQRVWFLNGTDSICRACSTGCAIRVDQNRNILYRLKPRYNPGVNEWWICDEGRFGWKFVHDERRITTPVVRRGAATETPPWDDLPVIIRQHLTAVVQKHGPASVAVQLSPEMACEEAWLLATFIRSIAPEASLALGDVQIVGQEEKFPFGATDGDVKFIIRPEKNPNRRGVEAVINGLGGNVISREDLAARAGKGEFKALWIAGGYPQPGWAGKPLIDAAGKVELLIVQDLFPGPLTEAARIVLPFCAWVEREGTFMNHAGKLQPFDRAIDPPEGAVRDGQYLYALAGHTGLYTGRRVREMMAKTMPEFGQLHVPPPVPEHQH
ncbi:MAG TPA: molybdopterin-dependent oxidoreductase [Phycisphaerae bacterium]|jgi:NADH-quinone oxidoreductase subunit G|nr:molybdopterin-dependent oxidoreductase [Phycisphaerae bacterium]HOB73334.1 molybdopterin-dependent oxidoreductase [Phycisphaerae bacterium]HQA45726.1 molybdopterin-dependent oxidoreductase [Phycisphaerae bacterium]